jgi:hypothetical protein
MAKRQPKTDLRLRRKKPQKEPYASVLLVCEGEKTEVNYFNELIKYYKLSSANIIVDKGKGSAPISIVDTAIELRDLAVRANESYDKIFCVFDCDDHESFKRANNKANNNNIQCIRSWPCFEFWLLLHFVYTRKTYTANTCYKALLSYYPDFQKRQYGVFVHLVKNLEQGLQHAARVQEDVNNTEEFNPSTEIHELVEYLQNIKGAV